MTTRVLDITVPPIGVEEFWFVVGGVVFAVGGSRLGKIGVLL